MLVDVGSGNFCKGKSANKLYIKDGMPWQTFAAEFCVCQEIPFNAGLRAGLATRRWLAASNIRAGWRKPAILSESEANAATAAAAAAAATPRTTVANGN